MRYSLPPSEIPGRIAGVNNQRLFRSLYPKDRELPIQVVRNTRDPHGLVTAGDTVAQFSSVPNAQMFMAMQQGISPAIAKEAITREMLKQKLLSGGSQPKFEATRQEVYSPISIY